MAGCRLVAVTARLSSGTSESQSLVGAAIGGVVGRSQSTSHVPADGSHESLLGSRCPKVIETTFGTHTKPVAGCCGGCWMLYCRTRSGSRRFRRSRLIVSHRLFTTLPQRVTGLDRES